MRQLVQTQDFVTAASCDAAEITEYGLKELYKQQVSMDDCTVFWDRKK